MKKKHAEKKQKVDETISSTLSASSPPQVVDDDLVETTLYRMTNGLPRSELQLIVKEAEECEASLAADIAVLEKALAAADDEEKKDEENEKAADAILGTIFTPLDHHWTVSALLGRMRDNLAMPRIPTAPPLPVSPLGALTSPNVAKIDSKLVTELTTNYPNYTTQHENTARLLTLCKKISSFKPAIIFKKPVKDEEAPGYTSRILFPMDLSLIRKMILARQINTYEELHRWIGLIAHNCFKFNGRESDYGLVAREFEALSDEAIRQAVIMSPPLPLQNEVTSLANVKIETKAPALSSTETVSKQTPSDASDPRARNTTATTVARAPSSQQASTATTSEPKSGQKVDTSHQTKRKDLSNTTIPRKLQKTATVSASSAGNVTSVAPG